jgi:hypothetical protein
MPLDNESRARGRNRQKQLGAEMKAAIAANVEAVLASLGRPASGLERAQAETLCGIILQASRLRDRGRSDLEIMREAASLMKAVPWLHGPNQRFVTDAPPIAPAV